MVAKALAVRSKVVDEGLSADFEAVDRSIREIERQAGYLEEIKTSSTTIKSGAERILHRVELMRAALEKQVGLLDTQVDLLRKITGAEFDARTALDGAGHWYGQQRATAN
jgi:hypothetical protein